MNTSKSLLILFAVCLGWLSFSSQAVAQDRFSLGPRFGLNFGNVTGVDESSAASGLVAGLTSTYSINENTGISVDLLYSEHGWEEPISSEYDLRYLDIPIYFNYFFGELGNRFRPKVYVGIVPQLLLNAEVDDTEIEKEFLNSFLLSLGGGLGFNYRVGERIWLNTDLRSYIGLSDIRDGDVLEGDDVKLRTVQFSLGLAYGISRYE
jgi:outer membrane protein W